jgi:hypothetical protein
MNTDKMGLRLRFPPREDIIPIFALIVFIVFSWSIYRFLYKVPSWLLFLHPGEILSILSYALALALIESGMCLFVIAGLGALLPHRFLRTHFVGKSSLIFMIATVWTILYQLPENQFQNWSLKEFIVYFGTALITFVFAGVRVHNSQRLQRKLRLICERLIAFIYIYIPIGTIAIFVVLIRNLLAWIRIK